VHQDRTQLTAYICDMFRLKSCLVSLRMRISESKRSEVIILTTIWEFGALAKPQENVRHVLYVSLVSAGSFSAEEEAEMKRRTKEERNRTEQNRTEEVVGSQVHCGGFHISPQTGGCLHQTLLPDIPQQNANNANEQAQMELIITVHLASFDWLSATRGCCRAV